MSFKFLLSFVVAFIFTVPIGIIVESEGFKRASIAGLILCVLEFVGMFISSLWFIWEKL